MKFEQIKTYLVGVLKGWFTNKTVLDKLSVNESNFLLYGDKPVAGTGVLYMDETVLWEGSLIKGNATLLDSVENYDYLEIGLNNLSGDAKRIIYVNTNDIVYDIGFNGSVVLSSYITDCRMGFKFTDSITFSIPYNGSDKIQVYKIIGIKYKAKQSYSLEEQIVGTWIDGKPLYQKTIQTTVPSGTGEHFYDINIADLDMVFIHDGCMYNSNANMYVQLSHDATFSVCIKNSKLRMSISSTTFSSWTVITTIRYTKTTDAATITI